MKTFASGSYTIAWFKIADFVARGEKERALNMYRLLMHSVPDKAISYQLEGDILLAFQDDAAFDRYFIAANMYQQSGKIQESVILYEHILTFKLDVLVLKKAMDSYLALRNMNRFCDTFGRLAKLLLEHDGNDQLLLIQQHYQELLEKEYVPLLYATYIRAQLLYGQPLNFDIDALIEKTVDLFLNALQYCNYVHKHFQNFLLSIQALRPAEFEKIKKYLNQN